jgi:hypothetical protein
MTEALAMDGGKRGQIVKVWAGKTQCIGEITHYVGSLSTRIISSQVLHIVFFSTSPFHCPVRNTGFAVELWDRNGDGS